MNGRTEVDQKRDNHTDLVLKELPGFVSEWHCCLVASRKTSATRRDYVYKVKKFLESINPDASAVKPSDITYTNVIKYFTSIQKKQNKDGTYSLTSDSYQITVWACLNSLFEYMCKLHYIEENYMTLIEKPVNHDLDRINQHRVVLTKDDFSEIQTATKCGAGSDRARLKQYKMKERDEAILVLFMTTGMRCTALTEINLEDLKIEDRTLTIIDKREKTHTYILSNQVVEILQTWIDKRQHMESKDNALFIGRGGRLSSSGVDRIVKKYTEEATGKRLSPHKLRSGYVTILYEATHDINFCKAAVGHSNITTTQRYIASDNKEKQKANELISSFLM